MNDTYLSRFWGNDYHIVLDVADIGRSLPLLWTDIAIADQSRRLEAFKALVRQVFVHMPETSSLLLQRTTDAYLVKVRDDVVLVADRQAGDQVLSYRGFAPTVKPRFGGSVGAFYKMLDGFCDFHSMGGLLPEREIRPIGKDGNEYWTEPSSKLFETVKSKDYFHIFNSGGKGQGYINLSSTVDDDPEGLLLWVDDDEPMTDMDFWDLFDNWTSIAMEDD
ncbi:hypothetical protein RsS62_09280 [Rhizobium dioscoreae]|uniref:hypothetical protein n=1 Tax=Rhizobium TaxID=379 RepID=UPI001260FA02|nr:MULTISPECIES: hypothetical protein [Rhizobium]MCZ3374465.1 hypothetical protein [Rhizobium sp. AG207R]GES41676.1 hypothetical protein RsS62_09280 [Rhizobium dioscoreae]